MLYRRSIRILLIGFLVLLGSRCGSAEEKVPECFHFDAARPYAIFDAWKELSTRKAMICLGENWQVLAGQLQNKRGEPIRNCPIQIQEFNHHYTAARLQTDDSGYFII